MDGPFLFSSVLKVGGGDSGNQDMMNVAYLGGVFLHLLS